MARLKTFQAHLGFFDTVVAAPSQKAALEAWRSRQNLFHEGTARVATDQHAIKAALANPGVVLKRLSGTTDPFVEESRPRNVQGGLHRAGKQKQARKTGVKRTEPKPGAPDRSKLDAAERAIGNLHEQRERVRAEFDRREQALHDERRAQEREFHRREQALGDERRDHEREWARREKSLQQALEKVRRAFRSSGKI